MMTSAFERGLTAHKLCDGTGWICEQHPWLPFGHDDCGGPGIPCSCNPRGEVVWKRIHGGGDDRDHVIDECD